MASRYTSIPEVMKEDKPQLNANARLFGTRQDPNTLNLDVASAWQHLHHYTPMFWLGAAP